MSTYDNLISNANKVDYASLFASQKIVAKDDSGTKTLSIAANTTLVSLTIPHGLSVRPYYLVMVSLNSTEWYTVGTSFYVTYPTDILYTDAYSNSTNIVIDAQNSPGGAPVPTAKTLYIKYWLFTL